MTPNPGHLPPEAAGKRVRVRLMFETPAEVPPNCSWPADGRGACCWDRTGGKFDIAEYEVLG